MHRRWIGLNHLVAVVAASTPAGGSGHDLVTAAGRLAEACGDSPSSVRPCSASGAPGPRWDPAAVIGVLEGGRFRAALDGYEGLGRPAARGGPPGMDRDVESRSGPARSIRVHVRPVAATGSDGE